MLKFEIFASWHLRPNFKRIFLQRISCCCIWVVLLSPGLSLSLIHFLGLVFLFYFVGTVRWIFLNQNHLNSGLKDRWILQLKIWFSVTRSYVGLCSVGRKVNHPFAFNYYLLCLSVPFTCRKTAFTVSRAYRSHGGLGFACVVFFFFKRSFIPTESPVHPLDSYLLKADLGLRTTKSQCSGIRL